MQFRVDGRFADFCFFFRDGSRIGVANLKQADKKHSDKITAADAAEVYLKANV